MVFSVGCCVISHIYLVSSINSINTLCFIENSFHLKLPDNTSAVATRDGRIFSHFWEASDSEADGKPDNAATAISSDPALYWAKLKRNQLRKDADNKKGSLSGSFTTNKGIVTFYSQKVFATLTLHFLTMNVL